MTGNEEFPPTPGGGNTGGEPAGEAGAATPAAGPAPAVKAGGQKAGKAPKKSAPKNTAPKKAGSKAARNTGIAVGVAALLVVVGAAAEPYAPGATEIKLAMNSEGKLVNAETLKDLKFEVTGGKKDMVLKLDGAEVEGTREGNVTTFEMPDDLSEGEHTFLATSKGRLPGRKVTEQMTFTVDKTAPTLTVNPTTAKDLRSEITLTGKADGASQVKINDEVVPLNNGEFSKTFPTAVAGVKVVALDEAGNSAEQVVDAVVKHPGMRAVHMTALAWVTPSLRDPVIQMIKDKKIDTVQLDIKDELGDVGYDSTVELAKTVGAAKDIYKIDEAVKEIHDLGARVTGRIVAFRDPKLAGWAVKNGKMDYVVQDTAGNAFDASAYGGRATFTSLANQDVWKYNIDLAVEAAKAGFDDIMFDYIRRPETRTGTLEGQRFAGIGDKSPEQAVVDFSAEAYKRIREAGAFVGAAVYGISSFTPGSVAQNIPQMAKYMDFISPMVYPSHWGPGEYSVASPNSMPYDIVNRSMKDFNRQVLGTNAVIIPWLQDFSLGVRYGEKEVRDQIRAAKDAGINSWLLWNASAKYTEEALDAKDKSSDAPGELIYSINKPGNNSEGTKNAEEAKAFIDAYNAFKDAGRRSEFVWPLPAGTAIPGQEGASTPAAGTDNSESSDSSSDSSSDDAATPSPSATPTP
jgi:hypothetical protein